ncbi:MAG: xanthine dehydrogenase family protein subunit M [Proteobacteria bacterium]|nr:xanthine dehydrogenase family protein subunit M [Pseudomonadota bacterium]
MLPPLEYIVPSDRFEACNFLAKNGSETKIIAGGTDLVLSLRRGEVRPRYLLDISEIEELRKIEDGGDQITIGAACTHTQISESPMLKEHGGILSEASGWIASRQIRNLGTIGGNVVNGSPAADTVPALMVLNGRLKIVSSNRHREVPLSDIYVGPYETNLGPHELVSHIIVDKIPEGARYRFFRLTRRKAMATARINGGVLLRQKNSGGRIEDIRISVGSVTPRPCRMTRAEEFLMGAIPSEPTIERGCRIVGESMVELSGVRQSTEYKRPVVNVLVRRALQDILAE